MAGMVPDICRKEALAILLDREDLVLKLYINDKHPRRDDTILEYIEASNDNGYEPIVLSRSSWSLLDGNRGPMAVCEEQKWIFTGPVGNVFGSYLVGYESGKLRGVDRFSKAPFEIVREGDQIAVTPRMILD